MHIDFTLQIDDNKRRPWDKKRFTLRLLPLMYATKDDKCV